MQRLRHMAARALAAALIASLATAPTLAWAGGAAYGSEGNRAVYGGSAGRSPALGSESGPEPEPSPEPEPEKKDLSGATVTVGGGSLVFDGQEKRPPVTVTLGGVTLEEFIDYMVLYNQNVNAGTATVDIIGIDGYEGTTGASFTIDPRPIGDVAYLATDLVYDGSDQWDGIVRSAGTLVMGLDYTLEVRDAGGNTISKCVDAGTYTATATGKGNYTGGFSGNFTIAKATRTITASDKSVEAGRTVPLGATASGGGALSYRSSDTSVATVSAAGEVTGVAVGTATITIHAYESDNYSLAETTVVVTVTGTGASDPSGPEIEPEPEKKDLSGATVTVDAGNLVYDGKAKTPLVTVALGGVTLEEGTDYTAAYRDNVDAGTATVTVTGTGSCEGTASTTFTIAKAMSSIKIAAQTKTYTGEAIAYSGKVTKSGSRGKVTYAYYSDANCTKKVSATNVKNPGLYYVKATLAESKNYDKATSAVAKLTIRPKGTSIAKVTAASAGFTVAWRKQATQTSGYQIQFSLSSEFKKGKTVTVTIPKPAVTRREVSKLGKKKAYYVRVRTFKKVGGKTYYSAWSKKKKVRTRK